MGCMGSFFKGFGIRLEWPMVVWKSVEDFYIERNTHIRSEHKPLKVGDGYWIASFVVF